MTPDAIFETPENQTLLVVCARRQIRNMGIAGTLWGLFNLFIGVFAVQVNLINLGILILGLLMLGAGIEALLRPSIRSLLLEAIVSVVLFGWNLFILFFNTSHGLAPRPGSIIFPAVLAGILFTQFQKLNHLKDRIPFLPAEELDRAKRICKELLRKKVKKEANIAESTDRKFRIAFLGEKIFCFRRDMLRAFYVSKEAFLPMLENMQKPKIKMVLHHPLGTIKTSFDRKNSEKVKNWLQIA